MSRSVLLVDPDVDALGDLASRLRRRGLQVTIADDTERAFERARKARVEVVLIARELADESDIVQRFALHRSLAELPKFILSSNGGTGLREDELDRSDTEGIVRKVLAAARPSNPVVAERGDFRGDLQQVSIVDLLQLLSMNRRTGSLSITTSAGAGEVRLVEGDIVDAVFRRLEGEKALYRLLGETEGGFAFATGSPSPMRRVQIGTNALLMEGLRRIDEVRELRERVCSGDDALLAVGQPSAGAPEVERRVADALLTPRTVDELLDELPQGDLEILRVVSEMLASNVVRRIGRGAARAELGDPDQLAVLASMVKRLSREGFSGPARLVLAGPSVRLATVMIAVGRIADAVVPAESAPVVPIVYQMATLRLGDGAELDVIGLPLVANFAPLWALTLPGTAVTVKLGDDAAPELEDACNLYGVRLQEASDLLGEIDEADSAQIAALLRAALEAAAGA